MNKIKKNSLLEKTLEFMRLNVVSVISTMLERRSRPFFSKMELAQVLLEKYDHQQN